MRVPSFTGAVAAVVALTALGCGGSSTAPPDATYTVRAEIVSPPGASSRDLYLHHEAVSDFRNVAGAVVGMESMTMPFAAAPGLDLSRISPGDRATVTFEVRWSGPKPLLVTNLAPLPAGTRLSFDPPDQPVADEPDSGAASGDDSR